MRHRDRSLWISHQTSRLLIRRLEALSHRCLLKTGQLPEGRGLAECPRNTFRSPGERISRSGGSGNPRKKPRHNPQPELFMRAASRSAVLIGNGRNHSTRHRADNPPGRSLWPRASARGVDSQFSCPLNNDLASLHQKPSVVGKFIDLPPRACLAWKLAKSARNKSITDCATLTMILRRLGVDGSRVTEPLLSIAFGSLWHKDVRAMRMFAGSRRGSF